MFVRYKAQTPAQTLPEVYKITQPVSFKDINLNAQLKLRTEYKMETWFWILGWILYILAIAGNGFTVLLVGIRRRLRTKTKALFVSLAVADFCVGAFVVPSLFFCDIRGGCNWPQPYASWVDFIRWLFAYASAMDLCSLALDRYMADVKPLKYVNFITARRVASHTDVPRGSSRVPASRTSAELKDKFLSHCSQIPAGDHMQIIGDPVGAVEAKVLTTKHIRASSVDCDT